MPMIQNAFAVQITVRSAISTECARVSRIGGTVEDKGDEVAGQDTDEGEDEENQDKIERRDRQEMQRAPSLLPGLQIVRP